MLCQWSFSLGGTFWHRSAQASGWPDDCIQLHGVWVMEASGDAGRTEALGATWRGGGGEPGGTRALCSHGWDR